MIVLTQSNNITRIRYGLVGVLVLLILLSHTSTMKIFPAIDKAIEFMSGLVKLDLLTDRESLVVHSKITMRSFPSMVLYTLSFLSLCLFTIYIFLHNTRDFMVVLLFYGTIGGIYVLLILIGKFMGDLIPFYNLARRLIDFIVSPLPVFLVFFAFQMKRNPNYLDKF